MSKYMIVGNSTAGLAAVRALKNCDPGSEITVISAERHLPYSKVLLTHLIAGKVPRKQLCLVEPDFYKQAGINLLCGLRVMRIDPQSKCVALDNGEQLPYDTLLVSTGSSPVFPAGFSPASSHVAGLRTLEDAAKIRRHAQAKAGIAVIGGGPVGVKLACALREAGSFPELIVTSPRILSQVADDEAAGMVRKRMADHGIRIRTGVDVVHLERDKDRTYALSLSDGSVLCCSLVVFCKGVRPNLEMFDGLLPLGKGIRVDRKMRTAFQNIYAAGDAAETFEITRHKYCTAATWPHAVHQGRLAGMNMAGHEVNYCGSLFRNAMDIFGSPFVSIGISQAPPQESWDVQISRTEICYRKLVYRSGRLVGAQLVGDVGEAGFLQAEIRRGAAEDEPEQLFALRREINE